MTVIDNTKKYKPRPDEISVEEALQDVEGVLAHVKCKLNRLEGLRKILKNHEGEELTKELYTVVRVETGSLS